MVQFIIDHLDPLGQGVSRRINAKKQPIITFIPKTLPGEEGSANIITTSKGVEFGELATLTKQSSQRIEPECVHYSRCSGCDYQHISYQNELDYKKSALLFLMRSFGVSDNDIEVIPGDQRFGYRNRVQLHYRHKYLGLVDANADQVLEIPECHLASPAIKNVMEQLYADKSWTMDHPGRGHMELYEINGRVVTEWNQPYAKGGFSQVNNAMNEKLCAWLEQRFVVEKFRIVLDLFSGNGNLSRNFISPDMTRRVMVDAYGDSSNAVEPSIFIKQDLFAEDAIERFLYRSKLKKIDILLLDPPRKGFSVLSKWSKYLKPEYIVYVSCNPATLARDLQILMREKNPPKIKNIALLDMFPSTRHFETIVVLKA